MSQTTLLTGWDNSMSEVRDPYWLSAEDRELLSETITNLLANTTPFPGVRAHLDAVLTELDVAPARDTVWPTSTQIVRLARGYPSDVVPIRMSDDEIRIVLTIPTLPSSVRTSLGGEPEAK